MLSKGAETLPNNVAKDYKALAKFYDARNYKKGLKNAEKILEKHPEHPQTLAMKALFQLGLGQQSKAESTAKDALMKSKMKSMFCWHTYGTVLKQKKNFGEAAKCFEQALNFQKDNMQLLRETASLQIQVRDHNNHIATRWKILQLKPNMIHNWVAFAVAYHLKGDFEQLYKSLASIQNLRASAEMKPIEISHYLIYRAIAFQDGQKFDIMYQQLTKNKQKILDEDVWNQLMLKCTKKLNKTEQAQKSIQYLIKKYPENIEYLKEYQAFSKIASRDLYKKIGTQFKSKIAKIYQLCYIEDKNDFKNQFAQFIKPYFQKNLISLFAEIQIIYDTTNLQNIIQQVFLQTETNLKNNNKYIDGTAAEFPTEHLWSLYLLAQHFSRKFETLTTAYEYINQAIRHTNTVTQFYVVKAQIQYKMHNNLQSLKTIDEARKTDLADRYMNNICIKYLLKCMKPTIAEDVLKIFMRDEASLYELQNQWYIIEAGKSFLKLKNFPAGLRHLNFVQKQFQDIEANQYDFHSYCIRKWTLKEYIEYINFNDNIYKDKKYVEAAGCAMEYLTEYAHQLQVQMAKPKEEIKQQEVGKKKKKKNKAKVNEQQQLPPTEAFRKKIDYFGKQYAQKIKAKPFDEAYIYARNVTSAKYVNKGNKRENRLYAKAFLQAIKIFIHFNKPLLVVKALKKIIKTQSDKFITLFAIVKSVIYLQKAVLNEKIQQVGREIIKQFLSELLEQSKTIQQYFESKSKNLPLTAQRQVKIAEIELALKSNDSRENFIQLYKINLQNIIKQQRKDVKTLQLVFYLCHRLQFFSEYNKQIKAQLNTIFGSSTTYFTDWYEAIDKLPQNSFGIYWLSDYDIQRQEFNIDKVTKQETTTETDKKQVENISKNK